MTENTFFLELKKEIKNLKTEYETTTDYSRKRVLRRLIKEKEDQIVKICPCHKKVTGYDEEDYPIYGYNIQVGAYLTLCSCCEVQV